MAFKPGYLAAFYLANDAAALQNLSPYADNLSLPQSRDQLDVSAFGTAAKSFIPGQMGGDTIAMSGPYDVTIHTQLAASYASGSLCGFIFGPAGSVAGQARSAGSVYVANYSASSAVGGRVEYSASLQITGAVANGTF